LSESEGRCERSPVGAAQDAAQNIDHGGDDSLLPTSGWVGDRLTNRILRCQCNRPSLSVSTFPQTRPSLFLPTHGGRIKSLPYINYINCRSYSAEIARAKYAVTGGSCRLRRCR
jgi:hypothetical protein